jgi:hypothetical protein
MGSLLIIIRWLWRAGAGRTTWILMGAGFLGNVSLALYSRQCRYYSAAIFFSLAIAYPYLHYEGRRRALVLMAFCGLGLLASNYTNYLALNMCLLVDYLIWGRRRVRLRWSGWAILLLPQVILALPIVLHWNPLETAVRAQPASNTLAHRLTLFWWNLRDINVCEFIVGPLIAIAPLLYFLKRDQTLLRGPLIMLVYIATMTALSPQVVSITEVADVRYLVPIIPLGIAIVVAAARAVDRWVWPVGTVLVAVGFASNLVHLTWLGATPPRCTPYLYCRELLHPLPEPYGPTAAWINAHVRPGQSILVMSDYMFMIYPMMFHAPAPTYAWQIPDHSDPQFAGLPPIHFFREALPDYIIAAGPRQISIASRFGYRPEAVLDVYWQQLYRPELFWRIFTPVTRYDHTMEVIYILGRAAPG